MNNYEYHLRHLTRVAKQAGYEMAYNVALTTIKGFCNDLESIQASSRRHKTHEVMGVALHIMYTVYGPERGHSITPDYPATLNTFMAWVVRQDGEITDQAMLEKITEALEAEIAAEWGGV